MWDSLQPQDQRGAKILNWILSNDLHILNGGSATWTSQITGYDSIPTSPSVGATSQQKHPGDEQSLLVALTVFLFSSKLITKSATSLLSQELLDGDAMPLTGPTLQMKLSQKWIISLTNQIYHSVYLVLMLFLSQSQLQQLTSEKQNLARNPNPGWLHMCDPKSIHEIASIW